MSGTLMILPLIADSQKHAVNPADMATRTYASIATTKGSTFHKSSQKFAWIIDSGATDHMTFDPGKLISRKSSTLSVVSNANGHPHRKDDWLWYFAGKLYYLDWASDSEVKIGKSVPDFNSFIKWWRLSFMPKFRFFILTMAENFSTMIITSSYKIVASYINTHALTLPNRMG
ncbi:unnamed protein product [Prunus brigantina]